MTESGDGGGGADEATEAPVLTKVSVAVVMTETLWPLPMLLSVPVAADRRR